MPRPVTLFTGQWADLSLDTLAKKVSEWGFDGVELACWGDHFEVDKALENDRYVREKRGLSIEQAVHKAAGIPARIMRFDDRGVIKVGAKADLVLFDVAKVRATSTYVEPFELAEGFDVVVVNGKVARENGAMQPGRHGRVLRSGRR